MDAPVTKDKIEYLLHAIANEKTVWLRGVQYSADDLRDMRGMTPSEIGQKLKEMKALRR